MQNTERLIFAVIITYLLNETTVTLSSVNAFSNKNKL